MDLFRTSLVSRDTTAELIRVLSYSRFRLAASEREDLLGDYLPWCETVTAPTRTKVPHCREPHDRPFLELALAAKADALVTCDKDLLALAKTFSVPIIAPRAFRKHLRASAGPR